MIELIAAIAVILILATLAAGNYEKILAGAEQAVCASRMRAIRTALSSYLQDNDMVWPQGPKPEAAGYARFWTERLRTYGIGDATWRCPTLNRLLRGRPAEETGIHYIPTMFDATPNIANRWATQPWLIEAADAHGKGPLLAFPDGSIRPLSRILFERGLR